MVRDYQHITDEQRRRLIQLIRQGMKIVRAAEATGVNYENAKAINRIFKKE
jgi:molybdenum-dependent DNA-binding transcriptional regulator ModE